LRAHRLRLTVSMRGERVARPSPSGNGLAVLLRDAAAALTITGAVGYALARGAYVFFYDRFGLTPEEAGIGYGDTLIRVWLYYLATFVVAAAVFVRITKHSTFAAAVRDRWMVVVVVVSVAVPSAFLFAGAHFAGREVQRGEPLKLFPPWPDSIGVRADAVTITWLGEQIPRAVQSSQKHRLIYLGRSESEIALFDARDQRTIRVPAGSVVVVHVR
jgi:hypothetical protein